MLVFLVILFSALMGVLPNVLFGYNVTMAEWWVIALPLTIIGNSIILIAHERS